MAALLILVRARAAMLFPARTDAADFSNENALANERFKVSKRAFAKELSNRKQSTDVFVGTLD